MYFGSEEALFDVLSRVLLGVLLRAAFHKHLAIGRKVMQTQGVP